MAIEASFTIDQHAFPLGAVFETVPDATVELDRVVPTNEAVIPYVWIDAAAAELSTDALTDHDGVAQVQVIDDLSQHVFLRIDWNLEYESIFTAIANTDITLLAGIGDREGWTFDVRAIDQEDISAFQSYCRHHRIPIQLTELHALSALDSDREYDLTEGQKTALLLAYSRGYLDTPRAVTQQDLADELEISRQAVSSRLRRGIRRLVASTLVRHPN